MLSDDLQALVCDFGLSKAEAADTSIGLEGQGSIRWQSIELLERGGGKTFASDLWAFGMVVYEVRRRPGSVEYVCCSCLHVRQILSGSLPYHACGNDLAVIRLITTGELPDQAPRTSSSCVSYRRAWTAARQCWNADPLKRGTADELYAMLRPAAVHLTFSEGKMIHDLVLSDDGISLSAILFDPLEASPRYEMGTIALPFSSAEDGHVRYFSLHPDKPTRFAIASTSRTTVCGTRNGRIKFFTDGRSSDPRATSLGVSGDRIPNEPILMAPNGRTCLVARGHLHAREIVLVDVDRRRMIAWTQASRKTFLGFNRTGDLIYHYRISSGGVRDGQSYLRLSVQSQEVRSWPKGPSHSIVSIPYEGTNYGEVSYCGDTLLRALYDGSFATLQIWNLASCQELWSFSTTGKLATLSQDGRVLFIVEADDTFSFYDIKSQEKRGNMDLRHFLDGEKIFNLLQGLEPGHLRKDLFVSIGNDRIAIAFRDSRRIRVWDFEV